MAASAPPSRSPPPIRGNRHERLQQPAIHLAPALPASGRGFRRRPADRLFALRLRAEEAKRPQRAAARKSGRRGRHRGVEPGARPGAERLYPHRPRRPGHPDHAQGRNGARHFYLDADAAGRGTRGRPGQGEAGTGAGRQQFVQRPLAGRPGHRRLDLGARRLQAPARSRRRGAHRAGDGGGANLAGRSRHLPGRQRRGDACGLQPPPALR